MKNQSVRPLTPHMIAIARRVQIDRPLPPSSGEEEDRLTITAGQVDQNGKVIKRGRRVGGRKKGT